MTRIPPTDVVIRAAGPWEHRDIAANTARFHVVEAGNGPLVILLHGFPTFWWTWRQQIPEFADAGYRVVAMDLRGYGGSDHTPHGYDPMTLAADVVGLIKALGESQAVIVGQGWGGLLAWAVAAMHPEMVAGIVPVSMPHPTKLRRSILKDAVQRRAFSYVYAFQLPFYPEAKLARNDAEQIGEILKEWSGSDWPSEETAAVFRSAMLGHASIHCALEYHRWALRSVLRSDGRRFNKLMQQAIHCPVLQIHGEDDGSISYRSAEQSEEHVWGEYSMRIMQNVGHFPHEENPEVFTRLVLDWLKTVPGYEREIEES